MNKQQLVEKIVNKTDMPKSAAEKFVNSFTETVSEALAGGESVQLVGFGTFEVRERAARIGHNPATGESINIPACKTPAFKPGKILKNAVNK